VNICLRKSVARPECSGGRETGFGPPREDEFARSLPQRPIALRLGLFDRMPRCPSIRRKNRVILSTIKMLPNSAQA